MMSENTVFPGVYVEELPSGVRSISGASTSDTAFVDYFRRGPLNRAVRISNYAEFERIYGGLDHRSAASYGIPQYFLNGGQTAWIVRVLAGHYQTSTLKLRDSIHTVTLQLEASNPGAWGNSLYVAVNHHTTDPAHAFNLAIRLVEKVNNQEQVIASEDYSDLDMHKDSVHYAPRVINSSSALVQLKDLAKGKPPAVLDFTPLGQFGGKAGFDGDLPPANPGDPSGARWRGGSGAKAIIGSQALHSGLYALLDIAPFVLNLLCIPAAAELKKADMVSVYTEGLQLCHSQRAFLFVDIPPEVNSVNTMAAWEATYGTSSLRSENAAVYFPRLKIPDLLSRKKQRNVAASGTLAGMFARIDATHGAWKAPTGIEASLNGVFLPIKLTDTQSGVLNPMGINTIRNFPEFGNVAWGARTFEGADQQDSEWKYIPVRRTALFIESSLSQGLRWVAFEQNGEPLWAQICTVVGNFLHALFLQEAFQGNTPQQAYFVKCDRTTMTQNDIDNGRVNIVIGFAPLKPAEFVIIKIQQITGQGEM